MKKIIALTAMLVILTMTLSGCGKEEAKEAIAEFRDKYFDEVLWDDKVVTVHEDKNGDKLPIPLGFKYSEGTKKDGFVIKDDIGNEFVWVPLDLISGEASESIEETFLDPYYRDDNRSETLEQGLIKSVEQYGGFYVSRNEMLKATEKSNNKITNNYDKSDAKLRYVTYTEAEKLSSEMYKESETVVSHLMYGAQWQAIMAWYASTGTPVDTLRKDSRSIGIYKNAEFAKTTDREVLAIIFKTVDTTPDTVAGGVITSGTKITLSKQEIDNFKNTMNQNLESELKKLSGGQIGKVKIDYKEYEKDVTMDIFRDRKYYINIQSEKVQGIISEYTKSKKYTDVIIFFPLIENLGANNIIMNSLTTSKLQENEGILIISTTMAQEGRDMIADFLYPFVCGMADIAKSVGYKESDVYKDIVEYDNVYVWAEEVLNRKLEGGKGIPEEIFYTYYTFNSLEDADKNFDKNMIKNIKGMAGGLAEWTQEILIANDIEYRNVRGGSYDRIGKLMSGISGGATSRDSVKPSIKRVNLGFRTCIYITPTEAKVDKTEEIRPDWKEKGNIEEERDGVPIPKGYKYIEGTKNTGIKIQDLSNEKLIFVWVPVDNTTVVKLDNAKKVLAEIYADNKLKVHGEVEGTQEQLGNNNWQYLDKNFKEEIDPKVKASIDLYKGFYVSQAELGYEVTEQGDYANRYSSVPRGMVDSYAAEGDYYRGFTGKTSKVKDENGNQKEITLTYEDMLEIAGKAGQEGITTSHMMYGAEWDAMMVWLMQTGYKYDQKKIIQDSSAIGKYTRKDGENYKFADVYSNNIWGLAGNLAEMTQELRTTDGSYVLRGGAYNHYGNNYPMASRFFSTNETAKNDLKKDNIGFRVTLCINVGEEPDNTEYNALKQNLEGVLSTKKYGEEANKILRDVFDALYSNYDYYQQVYIGLPIKSKYITDNFINVLKDNITKVNIYAENSPEGQNMKDNGAIGFGGGDSISLLKWDGNSYENYLGVVFHEMQHCAQNASKGQTKHYMSGILDEGGASYHQMFVNKPYYRKYQGEVSRDYLSYGGFTNAKDGLSTNYFSPNGQYTGYPVLVNLYIKLQMLVGYDVMQVQSNKTYNLDEIKTIINEKYGTNKANEILGYMQTMFEVDKNWSADANKGYDTSIKLEKLILECMKLDIGKIKDRNSCIGYVNMYRNYKNSSLIIVRNEDRNSLDYLTNYDVYNIDKIDDILIEKIMTYKVFPEELSKNKNAIKAILYGGEQYIKGSGFTQSPPYGLNDIQYIYKEEGNNRLLVLFDRDNNVFEYRFDTSGNITMQLTNTRYTETRKPLISD